MKTIYQLDPSGYFVGETQADESPLEPGVYLLPAGCVEVAPPLQQAGFIRRFVSGTWAQEALPEPDPEPATLTIQQKVATVVSAVQSALDAQARAKGYDSILSACSYAAQASGAPFQAEGAAFLDWRSAVWTHAYAVLDEVQAGSRPMPTPEEAVAMMPTLVLP